jgi:hypothetical protein
MFLAVGDARLALSELLRKLAGDFVDGGVKIILSILGVNIGTGNGKVHLNDMLPRARLVMEEDDMGGENAIRELLQVIYLLRHVRVDGCGKSQMSGAKVDLHAKKIMEFPEPARKNNSRRN